MAQKANLARRVVAEGLGTAMLLATVVGSGIMAERLASGNVAVALLANTVATGGALVALICAFGGISGAHFIPALTVCDCWQGGLERRDAVCYIAAQTTGAFIGVAAANLMFDLPIFFHSNKVRTGGAQWLSEFIATFGLCLPSFGERCGFVQLSLCRLPLPLTLLRLTGLPRPPRSQIQQSR